LVKYIKAGKDETSPAIKYDNEIIGLNFVILEGYYTEDDDQNSKVTLFEFKDGKIHMIKEYW
jgi:hypothetical protein